MNAIEEYNEQLQSGKIRACKKLKALYNHIVDNMHNDKLQYTYSQDRADKAVDFIESFLIVPHAQKQKYILPLWQKALISTIFGFVDKETGYRQYRECFLYVGRRNGKSCLGAAIAFYMLLVDGESAPEVYSAATDRQQAKIIWDYSGEMLDASALLRKYIRKMSHMIKCKNNHGVFVPLSKNSGSLDGKGPSLILLDELHAIKDRNMYNVLKGGTLSRTQPLTFIMSTGGYIEQDSLFDSKYEQYTRIINGYTDGQTVAESILPIFYEFDDKQDIEDERNWIKCNPNLGISKSISDLRTMLTETDNEKDKRDILVKQFNLRENSKDLFFEFSDIVNKATYSIDDLRQSYYIGGIDLSETTDLTCASALIYKQETDMYYLLQKYWIPADTLREHVERDKVPYDIWQNYGWLDTCEGNMIDQHMILEWFEHLQNDLQLYPFKIGYDPWKAPFLTQELECNFGKSTCVKIPQTMKVLSEPMYNSRALFKSKKINYNYNPIFLFCLANTQAKTDINGNIQPCKNRNSNKRIDGYSSFLSALACFEQNKANYLLL
jgi:phage terminase large subunit-like protein